MNAPTQIPPNPDYGKGCFRRRIRIDLVDARHAVTGFEDDFHAFALTLTHDGTVIRDISARSIRYPAALCPEAQGRLTSLVGRPLTADRGIFLGYDNARQHCTHLHDMLWLTLAQVLRGTPSRQFDITVPDEREGRTIAEIIVDGAPFLQWTISGGKVLAPEALAGATLRGGFNERLRAYYSGDTLEAAVVLQMGCLVSGGRRVLLESFETLVLEPNDRRIGRCFRFQQENVERRPLSTHLVRDFSTAPQRLLEWHRWEMPLAEESSR